MNPTSREILRQICKGGACPQTSIRTTSPAAALAPQELIGQILHPRGPAAARSPSDA